MIAERTAENKFSIFNSLITNDHREFYEKIINELIGISPICNQGKCTAAAISENATEQEQITDLMERVETFAVELHDGTKKLFDQFYLAKEDFCRSIYCTTAYIKVNLIDRTLLERTCDVQWWSLESAFIESLMKLNKISKSLDKQLYELNEYLDASKAAFEVPTLETNWTMKDITRYVDDVRSFLSRKRDLMFSKHVNQEFRTKADALAEQLGMGKSQEGTLNMLAKVKKNLEEANERITVACSRLEDIRNSYTIYKDLVIVLPDGTIVANANAETRAKLIGSNVNGEEWFRKCNENDDATEYSIAQTDHSIVEESNSLVFSTKLRDLNATDSPVIGSIGAFFDLEEEARIILEDYMPRMKNGDIKEGWFSFFTDKDGIVVGSSDSNLIEIGKPAHLPRSHRKLQSGETMSSYASFEGGESAIFSAMSDGYLDFAGLGWSSHLVVPTSDIFASESQCHTNGISPDELMRSRLIPEINKHTYVKVQDDKQSIKLISLNGIVFASKLGRRGVALGPVFEQITETGDFATSKMEELLREMAFGELRLNLQTLETFSKQAIDLIDRSLFERSAAIRWWATDQYLWKTLAEPTDENVQLSMRRLGDINSSYSMYRNIVVSNRMGRLIAASTPELVPDLRDVRVADHPWFTRAMKSKLGGEYAVQDVGQTELERNDRPSLIFSAPIRQNGSRNGEIIGVIGSLFDWVTESGKVLKTCLPKDKNGKKIPGCIAFYTNKNFEVIESSDPSIVALHSVPDLPNEHRELAVGESVSGVLHFNGQNYIIGSSRSKGYREYEGLGWSAHILRPLF
ncbi:PDC sensor domain-containing protein [Pirellulaceae bacterium SH501]